MAGMEANGTSGGDIPAADRVDTRGELLGDGDDSDETTDDGADNAAGKVAAAAAAALADTRDTAEDAVRGRDTGAATGGVEREGSDGDNGGGNVDVVGVETVRTAWMGEEATLAASRGDRAGTGADTDTDTAQGLLLVLRMVLMLALRFVFIEVTLTQVAFNRGLGGRSSCRRSRRLLLFDSREKKT